MKYEIVFDNNSVEKVFLNLFHDFEWSENNFVNKDRERNIFNTASFEKEVTMLRIFGADTEVGKYDDNGFLRIDYARINSYEIVKNGKPNYSALKDALWEIAHPKQN